MTFRLTNCPWNKWLWLLSRHLQRSRTHFGRPNQGKQQDMILFLRLSTGNGPPKRRDSTMTSFGRCSYGGLSPSPTKEASWQCSPRRVTLPKRKITAASSCCRVCPNGSTQSYARDWLRDWIKFALQDRLEACPDSKWCSVRRAFAHSRRSWELRVTAQQYSLLTYRRLSIDWFENSLQELAFQPLLTQSSHISFKKAIRLRTSKRAWNSRTYCTNWDATRYYKSWYRTSTTTPGTRSVGTTSPEQNEGPDQAHRWRILFSTTWCMTFSKTSRNGLTSSRAL